MTYGLKLGEDAVAKVLLRLGNNSVLMVIYSSCLQLKLKRFLISL